MLRTAARRAGARLASHPRWPPSLTSDSPIRSGSSSANSTGCVASAFRDGDQVRLLSRNRQPLNGTYPELVDALAAQRTSRFVVDGEVVAFQGRRTSFARLQGRLGITDPELARASRIRVFYYSSTCCTSTASRPSTFRCKWRKRLLRKCYQLRRSAALHRASRRRRRSPPTRQPAAR